MAKIENVEVNGLASSIYRSGYPMLNRAPTKDEFNEAVDQIQQCIENGDCDNPHIKRATKLATMQGGGHDQFLTGITVNFDMTFSNKAWVEAERYTFLNFISSFSTMHRIAKMNIADCCNSYASYNAIEEAEYWQHKYEQISNEPSATPELKLEAYRMLLYNLPAAFEVTAGMTTNYRCLKNIYAQRRTHRLPDWRIFCDWVETLPMSELIIGKKIEEK